MALADALAERGGGVWFGWSGETLERETRGLRIFTEDRIDFALADLTQAEYDGYYLGYANRALGRSSTTAPTSPSSTKPNSPPTRR